MIINSNNLIQTKELPKYNEVGFFFLFEHTTTQPFSYAKLVELIRKTPEAIGIMRAIAVDILSDGYTFEGPKVRQVAAEKFTSRNRFRTEFFATLIDWLMLGNGALWKGKIGKAKLKEALKKVNAVSDVEIKEAELKTIIDEEANKTKMLKYSSWSTMNIEMNEQKTLIIGYHQLVNGEKSTHFEPEEIIHGKFMQFDGKVYGFAPMEASINILTTLSLIKDCNGNFFQNGGVPDWMFILEKEMAGSPNVQKLEQVLRKYKAARLKHGNLVFTGEVKTVQMNRIGEKDMDFRMLSVYYTGILALAYNMPLARVAAILGMEASQNASGTDLSEAGYWRSISASQDYWEDLLNTQLFEPEFGVKIKFNRGYLNDQIKEAQRDVQMFEVLDKLIERGAIKKDFAKLKLKIPEEYWTGKWDIPEEKQSSPFGGGFGSPGSPPKQLMKGTAGQSMIAQKKNEATSSMERKESRLMELNQKEFGELYSDVIRKSETRKVNWTKQGKEYTFVINTPEGVFYHRTNDLSPVKKQDWIGKGRKVEKFHFDTKPSATKGLEKLSGNEELIPVTLNFPGSLSINNKGKLGGLSMSLEK